jgi:hexokinase
MIRISILVLLMSVLSGCVGTMAGAYRVFAEDLERLIGTNFNNSYVYNIGYLAKLQPDNTKKLESGGVIKTFEVKPPRTNKCKVHIEVNPRNIIVGASSEGPDCWRAY